MAIFPGAIATDSDLYIAVNQTTTQLTDNPLSNSATTVNAVATAAFPTVGFISIDAEIIKYTGKTGTSFTGCTRAADGTTAASHAQNSQIYHNVIAAHHNVLKDEVKATEQFISDLVGRTNTQVQIPNGTISLPGIAFASDTDSGLYRIGANDIALTVNGAKALEVDSGTVYFYSAGVEIGEFNSARLRPQTDNAFELGSSTIGWSHIYSANGTAALPAVTFSGDTDTGMYHSAANNLAFATGGVVGMILDSSQHLNLTDGTVGAPAYTFTADGDTGIYRISANKFAFVTGGANQLIVDSGNLEVTDTGAGMIWTRATYDTYAWRQAGVGFKMVNQTDGRDEILTDGSGRVDIHGTATNDSASAGFYGEAIRSFVSGYTNVTTTNTYQDLTSISLTAGDWDISATTAFILNGATCTQVRMGVTSTSGNSTTGFNDGDNTGYSAPPTAVITVSPNVPSFRVSLSATTTYYLKVHATFSAGNPQVVGRISARRVR